MHLSVACLMKWSIVCTLWLFNIAMENPPIFKFGKPLFPWAIYTMAILNNNQMVHDDACGCRGIAKKDRWRCDLHVLPVREPVESLVGCRICRICRMRILSADMIHSLDPNKKWQDVYQATLVYLEKKRSGSKDQTSSKQLTRSMSGSPRNDHPAWRLPAGNLTWQYNGHLRRGFPHRVSRGTVAEVCQVVAASGCKTPEMPCGLAAAPLHRCNLVVRKVWNGGEISYIRVAMGRSRKGGNPRRMSIYLSIYLFIYLYIYVYMTYDYIYTYT